MWIRLFALISTVLASTLHTASAHQKKPGATPPAEIIETAFGRTGDPAQVTQTLRVTMRDTLRFEPDALTVRQGETVRLVVHNAGRQLHELVLGTDAQLAQHAELMKKFPGMEHDEPYMAHVSPGKEGDIVWQFTQPGRFRFACLVAGHFDGGMVGAITVEPTTAAAPEDHAAHHAPTATASDTVQGEVRRVDREQNKITLRHGPLKALDMPGMTMVFGVRDAASLDGIKVGDKVLFTVIQDADGNLVVTDIHPAP